jgi:hypothetical protein
LNTSDLNKFFSSYRREFGVTKSFDQIEALDQLLGFIVHDPWPVDDIRYAAYMLATVKYETTGMYLPVEELCSENADFYPWYGRGYVPLKWEANYEQAGKRLGLDLMTNPDAVLVPHFSYLVMSHGMRHGWFTGKSLADYIDDDHTDYMNARRVINLADKSSCTVINNYAKKFEKCLGAATFHKGETL